MSRTAPTDSSWRNGETPFQGWSWERIWRYFEMLDRLRLNQGRWLDGLGWGPQTRPSRVALQRSELSLLAYDGHTGSSEEQLPILLVPAPIKRAYLWDLAPGTSVVEACLNHGWRPYLVNWQEPVPGAGLADYADRFLGQCVAAIRKETGARRVLLAGHSLGGLLSALFAALHPDDVGGLILIGGPVHFSYAPEDGALGPVIAEIETKGWLETMPPGMPGSLLSMAAFAASPMAYGQERCTDWLRGLTSRQGGRTHLQVERWTFDELPLARGLIHDLVGLYHDDGFMAGTLRLGERIAAAQAVTAPLLLVIDEACPVVPPAAMLPLHRAAASRQKRILNYDGDAGVGLRHVGPLVGRNAHAQLWPEILAWSRTVSQD